MMQLKMQFCSKQQLHQTMAPGKDNFERKPSILSDLDFSNLPILHERFNIKSWPFARPTPLGCPNNTPTQLGHLIGLNSSTIELMEEIRRSPVDMVNIPMFFQGIRIHPR